MNAGPIVRPVIGETYYAPVYRYSAAAPVVFGEYRGVIVDTPSQDVAVVYTSRAAVESALGDPAVWAPRNAAAARIARVRYIGRGRWSSFDWADELERADTYAAAWPVHTVGPVQPVPASGPGALEGYGYVCSCGSAGSSSLEGMAHRDRAGHAEWHRARGERVKLIGGDR